MRIRTSSVLLMTVAVLILFTTYAQGGGAMKTTTPSAIESQLGIRFSEQFPKIMKPGQTLQGKVVSPEKFSQHGFTNVKRGDNVTLKLLDDKSKFNVISGSQNKNFLVEEKGNIRLAQ